MGTRILNDPEQNISCLYDSVYDKAFGPIVYGDDSVETLEEFCKFLHKNAHEYSSIELENEWTVFMLKRVEEKARRC